MIVRHKGWENVFHMDDNERADYYKVVFVCNKYRGEDLWERVLREKHSNAKYKRFVLAVNCGDGSAADGKKAVL